MECTSTHDDGLHIEGRSPRWHCVVPCGGHIELVFFSDWGDFLLLLGGFEHNG